MKKKLFAALLVGFAMPAQAAYIHYEAFGRGTVSDPVNGVSVVDVVADIWIDTSFGCMGMSHCSISGNKMSISYNVPVQGNYSVSLTFGDDLTGLPTSSDSLVSGFMSAAVGYPTVTNFGSSISSFQDR